jgi:hypothetical protein
LTRSGRASLWTNFSSALRASGTSAAGGGTNVASARVHPAGPIQFWLRRSSPGVRFDPRTPLSSSARFHESAGRRREFRRSREAVIHHANVIDDLVNVSGKVIAEYMCLGGQPSLAKSFACLRSGSRVPLPYART